MNDELVDVIAALLDIIDRMAEDGVPDDEVDAVLARARAAIERSPEGGNAPR